MKIKDKIAIVTGGVNGIGKEIVIGYVKKGATAGLHENDLT